ncbi:aerotolerance regulator BatA [Vibrio sp. 10N.286.49.B3]|uniref:vWA domain-containing protein n=1 Tax=Vibrio sp. 10N.286.49.B3 TaxID=1880855 RepID=UPI000C82185F|nr:VWA domain-containing protein [Vibrio sp. 10N.286.49.B3]PMH42215.1 aerotolerance regulator BatA [Vibrio sp. 10N.286.49.B3]
MLTTIEFTYPLWFLVLPLPMIIYMVIPAYGTKQQAIKVPFFSVLVESLGESPSTTAGQLTPTYWQRIALIISWLLVVAALAKPTMLGTPQVRELVGRDVMVVVDLSGSMSEKDFISTNGKQITRLEAAKEVLTEFAKTREGDRLGLILFGNAAFLQTPFTSDQQVWLELLNQTEVAMAGKSTHLGDALGLAIKVFDEDTSRHQAEDLRPTEKVVIALTDGNDNGSFVEPIVAAKVAAVKGVRIHTIALGDPTTLGETALDMEVITRVAYESGGQAFEALDREQLSQAYEAIGKLEPQLYKSTHYQPTQSLHHYLIAISVLFYCCAFTLVTVQRGWKKKEEKHHA